MNTSIGVDLASAALAWNHTTKEFKVIDISREKIPQRFNMTHGAVWTFYRAKSNDQKLEFLIFHAWRISINEGISNEVIHRELSAIKQYRDFIEAP